MDVTDSLGAPQDSVACAEGGQAIIGSALDHYGRIDILIHNAGTVWRAGLTDISYEDFDAVLDFYLRARFMLCARHFR